MEQEHYIYRNCPIPGGGYVTSFYFDRKDPKAAYVRTDVGGAYRFDRQRQTWIPLNDSVGMEDLRETYPIALASDPQRPGRLYQISGIWQTKRGEALPGKLTISDDYGDHIIEEVELPFRAHGNLSGRGTGPKLLIDGQNADLLYYASQADGLWMSPDGGRKWEKLTALPEDYLTFVLQDSERQFLLVGTAGVTCATPLPNDRKMRGPGLYVSYDGGRSFSVLEMPADEAYEEIKMPGSVPLRARLSGKYLFVTTSVMPRKYWRAELAYSCDGGRVLHGRVLRYEIQDGRLVHMKEVTPPGELTCISGVDCIADRHLVCVSSVNKKGGDSIYRSMDDGETWEEIMYGLHVGRMEFRTSYMQPKYNTNSNPVHWISDLQIDPFASSEMWFNTGSGVFRTRNLLDDVVVFTDWSDGIEETVHLNLYCPPSGDVKLIDIVGDLGGFAFRDLDHDCRNSFDDADGNRYITCINADFTDTDPDHMVITARGNWTGRTLGGLIRTDDGCQTYNRMPQPFGISEKLDELLHAMEEPNVNPGWVAASDSCRNLIWSVCIGICLPDDLAIVSHDGGRSFHPVTILRREEKADADLSETERERRQQEKDLLVLGRFRSPEYHGFKAYADRVDPMLFFGFDEVGHLYLSRDGGDTFVQREDILPVFDFSLIDTADHADVHFAAGESGVAYLALREKGLFKLVYDKETDAFTLERLSRDGDIFYRIGLGIPADGGDFFAPGKAIYCSAVIGGHYGFYRTLDEGKTYTLLSDERQHFGECNAIAADANVYGRFFIGTGGRGVLYGVPADKQG